MRCPCLPGLSTGVLIASITVLLVSFLYGLYELLGLIYCEYRLLRAHCCLVAAELIELREFSQFSPSTCSLGSHSLLE